MKKILALVMAMALLVCSAAVFTVSAAEATFDEIVAAEKEYYKPNASGLAATHSDRIAYSDTEDGFSVSVRTAASALIGFSPKNKFVLDGAHIVLGAFSDWNAETKNYKPVINIGNSGPLATWGADSSALIINLAEGYIWSHQDTGNGGDGWTMVLNNATVVKAMTQYETGVSFEVDVNGEVYITLTNAAGTATGALQNYGKNWTDHTEAYITFGGWYDAEITFNYPLRAFHSGNQQCGVEAAQWFDNVTESDSDIHETALSDWDVFTDYWAANGRVWATEAANGGINVRTLSHPQLTLGVQTKSMVKLNGAHIVLDNISANTPQLYMAFGIYTSEDANVGFGSKSPLVTFDFNTNSIINTVVGGATLLEGSAVVAGMKSGKTVLSFEVKDNEVYMTLTNTAGTATVKFSLYGDVWTDRSEAYISFCHRHDGGADSYTTYDIVAIHDGAEECGLTLKAKKEAGDNMNADLAAASSGATVKLTSNAAVDTVVVKPGVTLDLNGYTLEADYAASFGDVVNGTLKVAKDNVMLSADNAGLPVWNGEAYVFVAAPTFQHQYSVTGSNVTYTFLPTFDANVHALLDDGADASNVSVTVRLNWTAKEGGKATQSFVYSDAFVQEVIGSYDGAAYGKAFTLLFNNAANLADLTYAVEIVSGTGVVVAPTDAATEVVA